MQFLIEMNGNEYFDVNFYLKNNIKQVKFNELYTK